MMKEKISDQLYKKISGKIDLAPLSDYSDLKTIHALDGREVGGFKAFKGDKLEKFSIAEFSLAPGMNYINVGLKPTVNYNIPRLGVNYMVMTEKIQFDVDLYPAVDLVPRQDYIDKYYELLTDTYLKEKKAPYFNWKISDRSWVRVSTSPYFFMSDAAISDEDKVQGLMHSYTDIWLKIWEEEEEVSREEAKQIEVRRDWVIRMMLEREPERHMLEKVFGKELTARMADAMV